MFQGGRNLLTDRWLKQQSAAAANNDDEPCTSSSLVPNTQRNKREVKRKEKRFSDEQVIQLEEYYITVGNPMNYDEIGTISKKLGTNKIIAATSIVWPGHKMETNMQIPIDLT